MSILIKGREMPKNCLYCPCVRIINEQAAFCYALPSCTDDYNGGEVASGLTTDDLLDRTGRVKTPSWCPLIHLPEKHGRLIDADVLVSKYTEEINKLEELAKIHKKEGRLDMSRACHLRSAHLDEAKLNIEAAPTIVPAEGGEADGNP